MSHNDNDPTRSARRHRPAIWAIAVALGLAVVAFLLFAPMGGGPETASPELLAPGGDAATGTATAPAGSTPAPAATPATPSN